MKKLAVIAAAACLPAALLLGALPAHADTTTVFGNPDDLCTKNGLSTNSIMLTNTTKDNGVTCAYLAGSGRKSIKPGQTTSWTSSSPQGVRAEYKCYGDDSSKITYANSYVGGDPSGYTYHVQPTNWDVKTKHYGGAVLWSTAGYKGTSIQSSQYKKSCNGDDGRIDAARLYPSSISMTGSTTGTIGTGTAYSITVNGAAYGGGTPATGQVALMVMQGDEPDATKDIALNGVALANGSASVGTQWGYKDSTGATQMLAPDTYKIYGVYLGTSSSTPVIPSVGWFKIATAAISVTLSAPAPRVAAGRIVTVASAPARKPAPYSGVMGSTVVEAKTRRGGLLSIACPSGGVPTQINVLSSNPNIDLSSIKMIGDRPQLRAPRNASTAIQAVCRPIGAQKAHVGNLVYGSARGDSFEQTRARALVFAGIGRDKIVIRGNGSVGDGGIGADRIVVAGIDAVGTGGFGDDVLRSKSTGRSMIIGGPGLDRLIGGQGETIINARDGRAGDLIECASAANVVLLDEGDSYSGPCTIA